MRESLDPVAKMKRDVQGRRRPFPEVKLLPGVSNRVEASEGFSREKAIEWAKETFKAKFHDHSGWLHVAEDDHIFLRGAN